MSMLSRDKLIERANEYLNIGERYSLRRLCLIFDYDEPVITIPQCDRFFKYVGEAIILTKVGRAGQGKPYRFDGINENPDSSIAKPKKEKKKKPLNYLECVHFRMHGKKYAMHRNVTSDKILCEYFNVESLDLLLPTAQPELYNEYDEYMYYLLTILVKRALYWTITLDVEGLDERFGRKVATYGDMVFEQKKIKYKRDPNLKEFDIIWDWFKDINYTPLKGMSFDKTKWFATRSVKELNAQMAVSISYYGNVIQTHFDPEYEFDEAYHDDNITQEIINNHLFEMVSSYARENIATHSARSIYRSMVSIWEQQVKNVQAESTAHTDIQTALNKTV